MNQFSFRQHGEVQLLICEPLAHAGFKHAFSTRLGGVSPLPAAALSLGNFSQDERANVSENRRRFLSALDATDWTLVTAKQIHSADICWVRDNAEARGFIEQGPPTCDALTANVPNTLLGVQTADCMPILLGDERTGAFAAVHAGWRGTLAGIVARTVERMQQQYGSHPADIHAALGPAISTAVFEVGPEVLAAFRAEFAYAEELISDQQASGKGHLNLNLANARQLLDAGLRAERIYDCGLCTVLRNDLFFSYRLERGAEKPVGRLLGVIGRAQTN